jgi:hypothetical protein
MNYFVKYFVDNHACILLSIKNTLGIRNKVFTESDRCPEAAAGQNWRTVSCLQDRLQTGAPKQEILLSLDILQFPSTTSRYNYYYYRYYRLPRKIRLLLQLLLQLPLPRSPSPSEPRASRSIFSITDNTV